MIDQITYNICTPFDNYITKGDLQWYTTMIGVQIKMLKISYRVWSECKIISKILERLKYV